MADMGIALRCSGGTPLALCGSAETLRPTCLRTAQRSVPTLLCRWIKSATFGGDAEQSQSMAILVPVGDLFGAGVFGVVRQGGLA